METIEPNLLEGFLVIGSKGSGKKASLKLPTDQPDTPPINPPGIPPSPSDSAEK